MELIFQGWLILILIFLHNSVFSIEEAQLNKCGFYNKTNTSNKSINEIFRDLKDIVLVRVCKENGSQKLYYSTLNQIKTSNYVSYYVNQSVHIKKSENGNTWSRDVIINYDSVVFKIIMACTRKLECIRHENKNFIPLNNLTLQEFSIFFKTWREAQYDKNKILFKNKSLFFQSINNEQKRFLKFFLDIDIDLRVINISRNFDKYSIIVGRDSKVAWMLSISTNLEKIVVSSIQKVNEEDWDLIDEASFIVNKKSKATKIISK